MTPLFYDTDLWKAYDKILRSWLGTPYRHLAGVKGRGADCTLFIAHALKEVGILTCVKHDYYPKDWHLHTGEEFVLESAFKHFRENCASGITFKYIGGRAKHQKRGDMLTFATTKTGITNHCSVALDDFDGRCQMSIQSIETRGVSIFPLGRYWLRKQTGLFRFFRET